MYKQLLTKNFFQDNPYLENSAPRFIYSILLYEGIEETANEIMMNQVGVSDERLKQITQEKELIQSEQNPGRYFSSYVKK